MITIAKLPIAIAGTALMFAAGEGLAQKAKTDSPQQANKATAGASTCLRDLGTFSTKMENDGYWLSGWGPGWGYGVNTAGRGAATPAGTPAAAPNPAGPFPTTIGAATEQSVMTSPRHQVRALYSAANVLGHRGDQQGCQAVLTELKEVYNQHLAQLKQAGVKPEDVTSWRQERILTAKPVEQLSSGAINVAEVTGTEIRNNNDKQLGTIDDVVVDPKSGSIQYVIANIGGFFGIGEEQVAVPWSALRATPGLNTFVLNVSENVMKDAPQVQPGELGSNDGAGVAFQKVKDYWNQHVRG